MVDFKKIISSLIEKEINIDVYEYIKEIEDPSKGDYAFPCFSLSKEMHKSPIEIADSLSDSIKDERIEKIESGCKRILDYYDTLGRTPDIIVFHGWQSCYEYLMNHRREGIKICLFIHSDGSPEGNKMILSYYPKLRGTDVEKKMDSELKFTLQQVDVMACITKIEESNLISQ